MKRIPALGILTLAILMVACGKDKFQTKPTVEIKDYNTKVVPKNGVLTLRINYFDKEGDIGNGNFYLFRERLNKIPANQDAADVISKTLPEFTNRDQGEIKIDLPYGGFLSETTNQNDTMQFKIAVTDREGNSSDTITSDKVVVLFQ